MNSLIKYLGILILQVIVTFVTIPLVFLLIDFNPYYPANFQTDPISLANTFTVFVTFIVVIGTVAITLTGIYFTSYFSKQKEAILNENINEIINALLKKQDLKDKVLKVILTTNNLETIFTKHIEKHLEEQKKDFDDNLDKINKNMENMENSLESRVLKKIEESSSSKEINDLIKGVSNEKQ